MAVFRDHVAVGALIAAVGVVLLYFYAIVTDPLLLLVLALVTIIASFLPDLDLDTGVPFYLVFGIFTIACGAIALYYALNHYAGNLYVIAGAPIATLFIVWFVAGAIFKHYTHHRGMMHSIPAMIITALLIFLAAKYLGEGQTLSLIFALAAAAGFLSHLMLDEVHSENVLDGNPFVPKHSLGTAFKFFSHSRGINLFTYLLLAMLIFSVLR